MKKLDGYTRAKIVSQWIQRRPKDKDGELISMEDYIKSVCKIKGIEYEKR